MLTLLLGAAAGLMLSSCIFDKYDDDDGAVAGGDEVQFILRISAVGTDAAQQPAEMVETVKSLRVVMIDQNGTLDVNEKVALPVPEYAAKNFGYIFIRKLNPGNKRVFLIANEGSVGEVSLTDRTGIPADVPMTSLTAMLDYFKPGSAANAGSTFADVLNRVYFKNDYSRMTSGNTIALPYSAYYELNVAEKNPLQQMEQPMYLVPVAAKFEFMFTNYRRNDAYIDDLVISSVNSHNYLNAQLDEGEKRRTLQDGTSDVWWIDWLEACARGSQSAEDTDAYNGMWGWITGYGMPVANEPMVDVALNTGNRVWMLNRLVDKANPSRLKLGPFYVPESRNIPGGTGTSQSYSLTFKVHDHTESEVTTLSGYEIETLAALFRATHTIVYVDFYESQAEIYVEIVPWNEKLFLGYVKQESEDD